MTLAPVERLYRRLLMAFGRALVNAVNDSGGLQLMQIQLGKYETMDNVPRFAEYGFTSNPQPGGRAIAIFMGGDRSNGAVIATDDPRYRKTGLESGEVCIYDDLGREVYFTRAGIVVNSANSPLTVNNATTVTINASGDVVMNTPLLKVSGDIQDNYATNPHTVAAMRAIYDEHTHNVPNVQGGESTVVSDVPNELE